MVTLSILMVPYASLLIPLMVWYKDIGLNDSLLGVGLVITLFQLPMSTFIMRNAFDAIPKDMEEAAMVDGCNSLQSLITFWCRSSSRRWSLSVCLLSLRHGTIS